MKSVSFVQVLRPLKILHSRFIFSTLILFSLFQARLSAFESSWIEGKAQASRVRLLGEFKSTGELTNEIKIGLEFRLKSGWHIYWKNPGLIGFPPKVTTSLPQSWKAELLFPAPFRIPIKDRADAYAFGYEHNVIYPIILQGSPQKVEFKGEIKVDYLVCDIQCVPETANFTIELPISKESISPYFKAINEAVDATPKKSSAFRATLINDRRTRIEFLTSGSILDLFLYSTDKVEWKKIERVQLSETGPEIRPETWEVESVDKTPPFEFTAVWNSTSARTGISGEVSPEKLNASLASGAVENRRVDNSNHFIPFAVAVFFAFIGGFILNLMPCVLPVVGIKTVSLLKLGAEANSYRRSIQLTIAGILASFLGLAVITILLKSLGHQVGWGFQFQSPAFVTFMILIIFLFALNLFDLFQFQIGSKSASAVSNLRGAFFEGVFATLLATPCSAPFLGTALTFAISQSAPILILMFLVMGLGLSTPYLALLFFPTLLRFLPAPGPWMITLRRALGYSMLFAVFFLLYIVHQQTEPLFLFAILGALFVIFILLRELQSVAKWIFIICVGLWSLQFSLSMQLGDGGMVGRKEGQFNQDSNVIPFDETKLQSLLNEGRNVYVMVTADWCLTCKFNEKTVIETEWFEGQLKDRNIVFMVADWTQRDEKIGKFLESHKRVAIPFSMLIDKNHELVLPELLTRSVVEKSFDQFFGK